MMPNYLGFHLELVYISGVIEIVLGLLLLIRKTQRFAAIGLVLLLIVVFPANIFMYQNASKFPGMTKTALLIRLPIQILLILWASYYAKKDKSLLHK